MKRIAIFCDGTWNNADAKFGTNVVKLSQAMQFVTDEGLFQQLVYIPGVGTGRGTGGLAKWIDKLGGGAFGWGLTENIEQAYRALVFSHETGDEIYVFGFSRGAYTARSLAGLLRSSGLPPRSRVDRIPEAITRYRSRKPGTKPDDEASFKFRHDLNADIVTGPSEADWRRENGLVEGKMINLAYVGVWDTVGALGLPGKFFGLAKLFNQKYQFHDLSLSRSVRSARHAVAIDERRRNFPPALWDNIDTLNGEVAGPERPYRQDWFPGDHGSVGGGGDIVGLSDDALVWIADGARAMGLRFESAVVDWHRDQRNPLAPLSNSSQPGNNLFRNLAGLLKKDRKGPTQIATVAEAARTRWKTAKPAYRPKTLKGVASKMN